MNDVTDVLMKEYIDAVNSKVDLVTSMQANSQMSMMRLVGLLVEKGILTPEDTKCLMN